MIIPSNKLADEEATERVELQCSGRLANYARYGAPQLPGQVEWVPCSEGHIRTLMIAEDTRMLDNFDDEMVEIIKEGEGDKTDYDAILAKLVKGR